MLNNTSGSEVARDYRKQTDGFRRGETALLSRNLQSLSPEETQVILNKLQVQQIQLEIQNEELRRAQEKLEYSQQRYFDLYDLAPVGYCTLSGRGIIQEINQTAATLIGANRDELTEQSITRFILCEDHDIYSLHSNQLFQTGGSQSCDLRMVKIDGTVFWVNLTASVAKDAGGGLVCRVALRDISKRKQAEEALGKREALLQDLFENVSDLIQSVTPEGKFIYVNRAWRVTLGYSEEDIHTMTVFDIIHPDCRDHCIGILRRLMSGEHIPNVEVIFIAKNGRQILLEGSINCKFEGDRPVATRGIFRDITERKRIADELIKVSHHYTRILNSSGEGILGVDLNGNHTFINPEAARLLGYTPEELLGSHSHSMWHHTRADGTHYGEEDCPIYAAIKDGTTHRRVRDEIFWRKDNTSFPVAYTSTPIIDNGSIVGAVLTFRDITEEKQTQDALYESESRLRTILETVQTGIILIDAETHRIVDVNSVAERLIGQSKESIIGSVCHQYICPAEEGRCPITDLARVVDNAERFLMTGDGTRIPIIKTVVPITLNGHKHILESFVDLSNQKKLEQQLMQARKMEAIGQLAAGVAHDFNNIIAAITGFGFLLNKQLSGNDKGTHYVSAILNASERATVLTQSLLAFGRKQHNNPQPMDLNTTIQKTEEILARTIGEDIRLDLQLTERNTTVHADSNQIFQILLNLAANARDAMPTGGVLTIETAHSYIDKTFIKLHGYGSIGDYVVMNIQDSGIGIDEETKQKIFEPFFTTKEIGKGTGLGLAMVYGIVKQHNGFINVYSEAGKGTAFKIYLPAIAVRAKALETDEAFALEAATETILLAEDDSMLRMSLSQTLREGGYTIIEACDGDDAVSQFRAHGHNIHLVLMDVIMPYKNAGEAYQELIAIQPDVKVILMSGYARDSLAGKLNIQNNVKFIPKPVLPQTLFGTIRSVLSGSRA